MFHRALISVATLFILMACQSTNSINIDNASKTNLALSSSPSVRLQATLALCSRMTTSPQQCYIQAFPKRCMNLSRTVDKSDAASLAKLTYCISSCSSASYLSRTFGACSTVI